MIDKELEDIIREKIAVYGEQKLAKVGKTYSIDFMRELGKIRNIKKIFKQWYWDDIEYPNILFRELHQMSF